MSMIDYVTTATTKYIEQMPKAQRKKYGQFFTSKETAVFMAELFDLQSVSGPVSILDPGAGSGILSVALIERMQCVSSITKIELVCYESDTNILELLHSNLDWVCDHATKKIEYKIISDNYILSQVADYNHMLWESSLHENSEGCTGSFSNARCLLWSAQPVFSICLNELVQSEGRWRDGLYYPALLDFGCLFQKISAEIS